MKGETVTNKVTDCFVRALKPLLQFISREILNTKE